MQSSESHVAVFFYGSYMNPSVLEEVALSPSELRVARLSGFDIQISPLANLVPSDQHQVYGVLAELTHSELDRLYHHAEHVLGGRYLPFPVVTHDQEGVLMPALCYIAPELEGADAEPAYLDRILAPARRFGFPSWYLERLESFR